MPTLTDRHFACNLLFSKITVGMTAMGSNHKFEDLVAVAGYETT
jgi:hypothetical protein